MLILGLFYFDQNNKTDILLKHYLINKPMTINYIQDNILINYNITYQCFRFNANFFMSYHIMIYLFPEKLFCIVTFI